MIERRLLISGWLLLLSAFVIAGDTARCELQECAVDEERMPGLIGSAEKNGEPTRIAYHYPHGRVFPPDLIRNLFHDGEQDLPSVKIELLGFVEVPHETVVDIYHAAGGVNGDHGTLYLDSRKVGQVGDDTVKNVIYTRTLPQGIHKVRWVLTGGLFQPNLLRFQNAKTGELLTVFHTAQQREEIDLAHVAKIIEAQGPIEGWPPATDSKAWTRVPADED